MSQILLQAHFIGEDWMGRIGFSPRFEMSGTGDWERNATGSVAQGGAKPVLRQISRSRVSSYCGVQSGSGYGQLGRSAKGSGKVRMYLCLRLKIYVVCGSKVDYWISG